MEPNKYYSTEAMAILNELFFDLVENPEMEIIFGQRKSTAEEQMKSFVLVTAPVRWSDKGAYQKTTVRVNCFCRERANGVLPYDKVGKMTDAMMAKFPLKLGRFTFGSPVLVHDCTGDGLGFGYSTSHIPLMVVTNDRYKNEDTTTNV